MNSYQKRKQELKQLREYVIKLECLAINLMQFHSNISENIVDQHLFKHALRVKLHKKGKPGIMETEFLFDDYKTIWPISGRPANQ